MTRTVWKFSHLPVDDTVTVNLEGAEVLQWLHAERTTALGTVTVWAKVIVDKSLNTQNNFHVRGTGHPFTGEEGRHFGTVIDPGGLVWHLFEEVR